MQDISLHSDALGGGDNALHIAFDPNGCSLAPAQSTRSTNEGGRLKFISPRGKQVILILIPILVLIPILILIPIPILILILILILIPIPILVLSSSSLRAASRS